MLDEARRCSPGKTPWIVGGAIRDELLGKEVLDLDIATGIRRPPRTRSASAQGAPSSGSQARTEPGESRTG